MKAKSDVELEQLRRENAKLRGDLLTIGGRVSHDLLTPLGGILISIQLLKETLPADEPSAALALESLSSSVDEIRQLVESMSAVAKATVRPLPKESVDMGEIVSAVLNSFDNRISQQGATVVMPNTWPTVNGVPLWLKFVWQNLLNYALQQGGSRIEVGWSRNKKEFRFWTNNNGSSTPIESGSPAFQPFDSLHGLENTRGLPLSIAGRLVELQGGSCDQEESKDGGPRLCFTLPVE